MVGSGGRAAGAASCPGQTRCIRLITSLNNELLRFNPFGTAEIKRMYVAPDARGLNVGTGILATLQAAAVADGVGRLVLETADELEVASTLYSRFGFDRIEPWGEYATMRTRGCYGMLL